MINKDKWTASEHQLFLEGMEIYGKRKPSKISQLLGTRTTAQVISHAQKYLSKIQKIYEETKRSKVVYHIPFDIS